MSFEEVEETIEDEEEFFFIFTTNEPVLDLYQIARQYLGEYYALPEQIILALIKEENLPLKDTLQKLPYIHNGYLSIILPIRDKNGETDNFKD